MDIGASAPPRECLVLAPGVELHRYRGIAQAFAPHAHPFFVIGLIGSGERLLTCGSDRYPLAPGDLVVFNPGEAHGCTGLGTIPFSYESLCLTPAALKRLVGRVPSFAGPVVRDPNTIRACREALAHPDQIESLISLVQSLAVRPPRLPAPSDILDQVARRWAEQPGAPRTLDQLAAAIGTSRWGASRAFSRRFGLSPDAFAQSVRIERARDLLADGMPPGTVAQVLGFSDQAHLTRAFKQRTGFTPRAYQRAHEPRFRKDLLP